MLKKLKHFFVSYHHQVPNETDPKSQHRDQWLPNPTPNNDETQPFTQLHTDAMEFVGKMLGIAMRNELCLPLNFASIVWKALSNDKPTLDDVYAVDATTLNITHSIRHYNYPPESFLELELYFRCKTLDGGRTIELIENGSNIQVSYDRKEEYCLLLEAYRLHEFDHQLSALRHGLSTIVPTKPLTLFTWEEVATFVTGKPGKMNLVLLKKHTTYNRWSGTEQTIVWLWEILEEMNLENQAAFLKFTWGRTRLPLSSESFIQPMKLSKRSSSADAFPISHTCFFEIEIPEYTSKEVMLERIMYAIIHCTSIDGDGNAGNADGWDVVDEE